MKIKNSSRMKKILIRLIGVIALVPVLTYAQNTVCPTTISNIGGIICKLNEILTAIIPLLIALGVVYFVWGVVQYMINDAEEAKKKGKDRMIYGIIGLVVIVSVWGFVAIIAETFNVNNVKAPVIAVSAQTGTCALGNAPKLSNLLEYVTCMINKSVIPLIFAIAVALFVWGIVQYVLNTDNEEKRKKGKQFMIWGVIALTVMVSVWGLVKIVGGTFGVKTNVLPQVTPN
jgi:uncharacterized membrane protein YidH (DUF202 family)